MEIAFFISVIIQMGLNIIIVKWLIEIDKDNEKQDDIIMKLIDTAEYILKINKKENNNGR